MEQGKTVTFTATPNSGYQVKGWMLDGKTIAEAGKGTEYKHTVTKPANITVSFKLAEAILTLEEGKKDIKIKAKTADGSAIIVKGCTVATLANDTETTLTATGSEVILKGNITEFECKGEYKKEQALTALDVQGLTALKVLNCEYNKLSSISVQGLSSLEKLDCSDNQLTELNIQGCAAFKKLECYTNKLNADAFKKLFNDLPTRTKGDRAEALIYKENEEEGNHKDFATASEAKTAFENAKSVKHWKMQKKNASGDWEDI